MRYSSLAVYFMTGTGNSYRVAQWVFEVAEAAGLSPKIKSVRTGAKSLPVSKPTELLVFVFPTHGFTAPWRILKYFFCLPSGKNTPVVLLPTRGALRICGVNLPGLEGTAGYLPACLLWLRGYRISGITAVDMPSNWTALHWGLSPDNAAVITELAEQRVKQLVRCLLKGHRCYEGILPFLLGILLLPVSFLYLILGQPILAKSYFADSSCVRCGLCEAVCPHQAVKRFLNRPYWTFACDNCMACLNFCPTRSIQASPLLAAGLMASVSAAAWLFDRAAESAPVLLQIRYLQQLVQYGYFIAAIFMAYVLFHCLLANTWINKLLAALCPTKYYRRYKAVSTPAIFFGTRANRFPEKQTPDGV